MKKIVLAAVVSLLASLGVVVSSGAAQADPYPGNIPTRCKVKIDNNTGKAQRTRILALVEVPSSRLHAKGSVKVVVKRKNGSVLYRRTTALNSGRLAKDVVPKFAGSGPYVAKISFKPRAGTVFLRCSRAASYRL